MIKKIFFSILMSLSTTLHAHANFEYTSNRGSRAEYEECDEESTDKKPKKYAILKKVVSTNIPLNYEFEIPYHVIDEENNIFDVVGIDENAFEKITQITKGRLTLWDLFIDKDFLEQYSKSGCPKIALKNIKNTRKALADLLGWSGGNMLKIDLAVTEALKKIPAPIKITKGKISSSLCCIIV